MPRNDQERAGPALDVRTGRTVKKLVRFVPPPFMFVCILSAMSPARAVPSPQRGWVKNTVLEQFHITATEIYESMAYTEDVNPARKENGVPGPGYCSTSAFPGWTIDDCRLTDYYGTGPNFVYVDVSGHFTNVLPGCWLGECGSIRYRQTGEYYNSTTFWNYYCGLIDGALPIAWSMDCAGGKGVTGPPAVPDPRTESANLGTTRAVR
jgi:hypothetical protein